MDIDDEKIRAIKEKRQRNLSILKELASKELNDGDEPYVFGHIEDIHVGSVWATRSECSKCGVHKPLIDCVHYGEIGACSLILENINPQDADLGDWFTYTGHSDPAEEYLSRSSLALMKNATSGLPVRIVRRIDQMFSYSTQHIYRYDGLYVVRKHWTDVDVLTERKVFKCAFQRCKNQSPIPCHIEKKSDLKPPYSRKNANTSQRRKHWKTKQNFLFDLNKLKQENVEVNRNSKCVEKVTNSHGDNKSYKKLCKGDSNIYKDCYIKVHQLSHQYLYDKYSISVDDFKNSNFNSHKRERRKRTYSLSGFPLKRNYTSDCEINKEQKIKLSRNIRSRSLNRTESVADQTINAVNIENSKRSLPLKYSSKSELDNQNILSSNQKNSAQVQQNVDLYNNDYKRDLSRKFVSTRPESGNASSELQDENNCESDSDSSDLLQLRISPPIINENVGSLPSDTEEELFAGFNSKCYFYKNKVIVEFNGKVHVCNEHNYFVCDESDFSVLCEDDRHTSYHDLKNSEGDVYSL